METKKRGRPKGSTGAYKEVHKKMYSFRLSDAELKAVRKVLAKMRNKLVVILIVLMMLIAPCNALTLNGGVEYTEETARQEAFKGVDEFNPKAVFSWYSKKYWFDLNTTNDILMLGESKARILGVLPFSVYQVVYKDEPSREYLYEKTNKGYRLFATIIGDRNAPYPQKLIKYDIDGHLINIEFSTGYQSFIFDKNGKLTGKWNGLEGQTADKKVRIKSKIKYFE